jgi:hypothetical protein
VARLALDIGSDTFEVSINVPEGIIYSQSVRRGTGTMDGGIVEYVKRKYGVVSDHGAAQRIRIEIGDAYPSGELVSMTVAGRDMIAGVARGRREHQRREPRGLGRAVPRHRRGRESWLSNGRRPSWRRGSTARGSWSPGARW